MSVVDQAHASEQGAVVRSRTGAVRPRLMVVVHVVMAAVATIFALVIANHNFMDLDVYRAACKSMMNGTGLYGSLPGSPIDLKYIYPPFAAVILVPVSYLPAGLLHLLWTVLTVGLVFCTLVVVMRRLGVATAGLTPLALLAPTLLLEPIRGTLGFGQINMVVVALVVLDCMGVIPRRFRGIGIGLAAALKVTPLAFGLLLLVRKDYPSIARAGGAFLFAAGVGAIFVPSDSKLFWTDVFFDTKRGGQPWYGPNQAITGVLTRVGVTGTVETLVWIVGVFCIVTAAAYAAWHFTRAGEHVAAFSVVALASLLAAPFAASHHWSYIVVLLPLLAAPQYRSWRYPLALATVVFLLGAQWNLPCGGDIVQHHWSLMQQFVGDGECLTGIVLLIGAVIAARGRHRAHVSGTREIDVPEGLVVPASS